MSDKTTPEPDGKPEPKFEAVIDPNAPKGSLRPLVELLLRKAEEELRRKMEEEKGNA